MKSLLRFLRTWMLAVAMLAGVLFYFAWSATDFGATHTAKALTVISVIQPLLIFTMLFVTFCKINPRQLVLRRWHGILLGVQVLGVLATLGVALAFPTWEFRVIVEAALLCLLCPTATSAVVVTGKLGGDVAGLTSYTLLINLAVAFIIPAIVPFLHPHPDHDFYTAFFLIVGKIFPMLILPFFAAIIVRQLFKSFHQRVVGLKDFAFYLWAVSLMLAIAMSTHFLMTAKAPLTTLTGIFFVSLLACLMQFIIGRKLGERHHTPIATAQALGQKNTIFLIWAGYTFFNPVSSIAGGFYSIFHNLWNSRQLAQQAKKVQKEGKNL